MNYLTTPLVPLIEVQVHCGLSQNITNKEYDRFILTSQNTMLREQLGEDLVDALIDYVVDMPVDANLEALLENYVKPLLSHDSFVHYAPQASMKSVKAGVKRMVGESTENGARNEFSNVTSLHQKNSDAYLKRMLAFLELNLEIYPLYASKCVPILKRSIFTSKG
tara:strand:+ start:1490 stop:1984 length:495 start_codon:yes stop_codon:yes gene_type:complete